MSEGKRCDRDGTCCLCSGPIIEAVLMFLGFAIRIIMLVHGSCLSTIASSCLALDWKSF